MFNVTFFTRDGEKKTEHLNQTLDQVRRLLIDATMGSLVDEIMFDDVIPGAVEFTVQGNGITVIPLTDLAKTELVEFVAAMDEDESFTLAPSW